MNKIFRIWMQPIQARLNIGRKISLYFFMALFPSLAKLLPRSYSSLDPIDKSLSTLRLHFRLVF